MARSPDPVSLGSPRFHTVDHGGFLVTDVWFPAGLVLPSHFHDRTVVAVTLAGAWDSVIDRRPRESTAGMMLTEPAGERHANHFGAGGARVLIMQPDPMARRETLERYRALLSRVNHRSDHTALALARRLAAEIRYPDTASPLAIEGLALEILAALARQSHSAAGSPPPWFLRAVEYLHTHFLEVPTLDAVAAIAGVHPAHLGRAFRTHLRTTPAAYVRRLRLDWAAERLATTPRPIAEIALAAGFADQSHFTRAFRRHTGLQPKRFREATDGPSRSR